MRLIAASMTGLVVLSACTHNDEATQAASTSTGTSNSGAEMAARGFEYTCNDGATFNARIDQGNVILTVDGQSHTLPPDVNSSGAHYTGDNLTFIAQGKEATLIRAGESARTCHTS